MRELITITGLAMALSAPVMAQETIPPDSRPFIHQLQKGDVDAWLDGLVPYALDAGDLAGAVVTIVADGEVLTQRGFGDADTATGAPVDPERTLFRIGSVSKLMTWTAVMQLVEQGVLDLDADINRYLDFAIPAYAGQPITLRQIMTHSSGFEEQLKHVLAHDMADSIGFEELVREHVPARIFAPGTTPAYSNYATALAGYIVQRASGQPYSDYVSEHIFAPLGMETATFSQEPSAQQRASLSQGYDLASGEAVPFEIAAPAPAGAMSAAAPDMARFMLAHLNEGALDDERILRPETARLMHARQPGGIGSLNGMALGFYENAINGRRVIGHGGDTVAFHADLNLFLDEGVGVFIAINSTGENDAAYRLRALLFSQFADRYFPDPNAAVPEDIEAGNAPALAGQWTSTRRPATTFLSLTELISPTMVSVDENGRINDNLPIMGAVVRDWVEVEPFLWQARNGHERLAAEVEDGAVTRFSIDSIAPTTVFEPVPWQRGAAWIIPALAGSLGVLALTGLQWPIAAVVRRRHRVRLDLSATARAVYHGVRLAALVVAGTFTGWFVFVVSLFGDLTLLGTGTDGVLMALQALTVIGLAVLGATASANVVLAVRDGRGAWSILWAVALVLATIVAVWVAFVFNLLKIGVFY